MLGVALALIRVVGMWVFLAAVFTGLGLLVRRAWSRESLSESDRLLLPWLGWAAALAVLQVWHVWRPVDGWALALVAMAGATGLVGPARRWRQWRPTLSRERYGLVWGVVLAFGVANHAVMQPAIYDSGLYHLNGVAWAKAYPLAPGLVNLHNRLGMNNASFLFAALVDVGPFAGRSHHLASGFLIGLLLWRLTRGAWALARRPGEASPATLFYALMLAPVLAWTVNTGYASSPSPDVPCFVLGVLLTGELMRLCERLRSRPAPESPPAASGPFLFGALCLLAMAGITVKQSFAVFGAGVVGLACLAQGWRTATPRGWSLAVLTVAGLGLAVMGPWIARTVLLTGYPFYPLTFGQMPVAWAAPREATIELTQWVYAWARMPHAPPESVLHDWAWLAPWFRRVLRESIFDVTAPLVSVLAGLGLIAWRSRQTPRVAGDRLVLFAFAPTLAGLLVWFLTAPDPRFQGAMLWTLGAGAVMLGLRARSWARHVVLAHGLLVLAIFVRPLDLVRTWKDPGPARQVPMKTMVTRSGLTVYVPVTGDQPWNSPLPATPYFSPLLRLREPGNLAGGFVKDPPVRERPPSGHEPALD